MLNVVMLNVVHSEGRYAECGYAECRYAERCYAECRYAECNSVARDLPGNNKRGWKWQAMINTLAYCAAVSCTAVKSFISKTETKTLVH